jgi:hypothetical protein
MRSLLELLRSTEGLRFLEERGVFTDQREFVDRLRSPAQAGLAQLLGLPESVGVVYVAHQTHLDLRRSVVCKFLEARDLATKFDVAVATLWLDMDRAGADKGNTTLTWPVSEGSRSVRLVPQRVRDQETRFIPLDGSALHDAFTQLGSWLATHFHDDEARERAEERLAGLRQAVAEANPATLAEAGRALPASLLEAQVGVDFPWVFISRLGAAGLLSEGMHAAVSRIDDFVRVYNEAIEALIAADVDPQVRPLDETYLPLHYCCSRCGARRKLVRERNGPDQFAVASCSCGSEYRFHLGSSALSIEKIEATGRWSTDVTLPAYLNGLAGGLVAGRSSALYGMVLNDVVERVLGQGAIPMLVPADLPAVLEGPPEIDSLLYDHLVGPGAGTGH